MTEQGKQPALNSERIASLYGLEGYRLILSDARCGDGTITNFLRLNILSMPPTLSLFS